MKSELKQLKAMADSCSVLYVEDDPEIAAQMQEFLSNLFPVIVYAKNGKEGLEKYKLGSFDLVIADILMPEMDGLTMSRGIRELNSEQDLVIMSAHSEMKYLIEAINIGVEGYILKPADYRHLIGELARVMRRTVAKKENKKYQQELEDMVEEKTRALKERFVTDELTGLHNRNKLLDDLQGASEKSLMLLDIDNFSFINESYGIDFADKVLVLVSHYLRQNTLAEEGLFRVGGDKFVVVSEVLQEMEMYDLAMQIRAFFMEEAIEIDEAEFKISFTIGIDSGLGSDLLKNAETAIKGVRELGKNRIAIYKENSPFELRQKANILWIDRIKKALNNEYFFPCFQPIMHIASGEIKKYECLARMREEEAVVPPGDFLPPAKIAGLIPNITRQIVDKSFRFYQGSDRHFSINIADYDLREGYLLAFMEQKALHYGIDPKNVILEILESISTQDTKESIEQLRDLKKMGFRIAVDDFGTESSNFSRLLDLDVDYIKVDGSFIKYVDTDRNAQKITESIVSFAKSINAEVIAEFVHNQAVYEQVKAYGIDYAQGYFIGEPKEGY